MWEARNPWLIERMELAPDSCGAGASRGGLGLDISFRMLEDCWLTSAVERTKNRPWGLAGGRDARANSVVVEQADGTTVGYGKVTRLLVPRGAVLHLHTGGGGGYGAPHDRDPERVRADLREGYITEPYAREHYPHAFEDRA